MPALAIGTVIKVLAPWGDGIALHQITGAAGVTAEGAVVAADDVAAIGWQYQLDGNEGYLADIYVEEVI